MADDQDQHGRAATAESGPPAVQGKSRDTAVMAAATSTAGLIGSPDDARLFYPPGTEP